MRKPFLAGNWKMNTDTISSASLAKAIDAGMQDIDSEKIDVAVIPPFVYIPGVVAGVRNSKVAVGAQDIYFEEKGAFTGEISPMMLKDVGCTYALCGHSERRHVIKESDELINKKVHAAISGGILPILCIGELLEDRQTDKTTAVVSEQVKKGLDGLSEEKVQAVTLAYEPVWAIGTGLTATGEQAQEVHAMIRKLVTELYNSDIAEQMRIQYGGSAKPENTAELMAQPDIDGLLIGGAALKADSFLKMIQAAI